MRVSLIQKLMIWISFVLLLLLLFFFIKMKNKDLTTCITTDVIDKHTDNYELFIILHELINIH